MTTFIQLHLLTAHPASNLNRDDTGSPKTLKFGGAERLRVSSQSLKRAIRTSDLFASAIGADKGIRSQSFARALVEALQERGIDKTVAIERVKTVIEHDGLGKAKKEAAETEQLVHLGPDELKRLGDLVESLAKDEKPEGKSALVLLEKPKAVDIAMFGRMLADAPKYNVEAAVQVAHAFTTHRVTIEDDYYTAVDDLKNADREEDRGAGFIGIQEYGAGLFYLYVCIDADLLVGNLSNDKELSKKAVAAFIEAAAKVSPKGKQNSYASRSRASYIMAEVGPEAPRTLAAAFMKPVMPEGAGGDMARGSIIRLETLRKQFADAYGDAPKKTATMDVTKTIKGDEKAGTLADVINVAMEAIDGVGK
jgi:CRISPR system Cascade subunit CasC